MQRRRPGQSGPCQEGALRIDFERRNPCTAAPPQETASRVPRVVFPVPPLHCAIFMIRPTMRRLLEECAASRRPTSVSS